MLVADLAASLTDGLLLGFVYGLAAMGLTLIWGVMRSSTWPTAQSSPWGCSAPTCCSPTWGSIPTWGWWRWPLLALLFGFVIYGVAVHRVINAPYLSSLLATFAVNMIIIGVGTAIFSTSPQNMDFSMGSIDTGAHHPARDPPVGGPGLGSHHRGPLSVPLFHPARQGHPGRVR